MAFSCNGLNKKDIRDTKIGELNTENLKRLFESGLLSESEAPLLGAELINMTTEGLISDTMTYGQLFDLYEGRKKQRNALIAQTNNFGRDTVYLRTPTGEKMVLGLGEMSLEKLILREAEKEFPKEYENHDYNSLISPENMELLASVFSSFGESEIIVAVLAGNVMQILTELGIDVSKYRIGDMIEIGKRVKDSKEFEPFVTVFD